MKFTFTPEEAHPVAVVVARHYRRHRMKVRAESAVLVGAPYRTSLLAESAGLSILIEAQGEFRYHKPLKDLALWLSARRSYVEMYVAVAVDASMRAGEVEDAKKDGVGLLIVGDDKSVMVSTRAKNPALVVTPEPTLAYGQCKADVAAAVEKFNETNRKDGLRDMCELVERETEALALKAVRKGWLTMNAQAVIQQDWNGQINLLASSHACAPGFQPLLDGKLKVDMHSFRGARNLLDHKVMTKRADAKRQRQFAERMMQGPRLVAELVALGRKVK